MIFARVSGACESRLVRSQVVSLARKRERKVTIRYVTHTHLPVNTDTYTRRGLGRERCLFDSGTRTTETEKRSAAGRTTETASRACAKRSPVPGPTSVRRPHAKISVIARQGFLPCGRRRSFRAHPFVAKFGQAETRNAVRAVVIVITYVRASFASSRGNTTSTSYAYVACRPAPITSDSASIPQFRYRCVYCTWFRRSTVWCSFVHAIHRLG